MNLNHIKTLGSIFFKEFIMKENKETKKSSEKEPSKGGCGCGK